MFKHILIPTDGSTIALKAAKAGIRFAAESGARVTAFHAIDQWQPAYTSPDLASSRTFVDFERLARERGEAEEVMANRRREPPVRQKKRVSREPARTDLRLRVVPPNGSPKTRPGKVGKVGARCGIRGRMSGIRKYQIALFVPRGPTFLAAARWGNGCDLGDPNPLTV